MWKCHFSRDFLSLEFEIMFVWPLLYQTNRSPKKTLFFDSLWRSLVVARTWRQKVGSCTRNSFTFKHFALSRLLIFVLIVPILAQAHLGIAYIKLAVPVWLVTKSLALRYSPRPLFFDSLWPNLVVSSDMVGSSTCSSFTFKHFALPYPLIIILIV